MDLVKNLFNFVLSLFTLIVKSLIFRLINHFEEFLFVSHTKSFLKAVGTGMAAKN